MDVVEQLTEILSKLSESDALLLCENIDDAMIFIKSKTKKDDTYSRCIDAYNNFILSKIGLPARINGLTGRSMKNIIEYLRSLEKIKCSDDVVVAFEFILSNYDKWDNFHQQQTKLNQIDSNLQNILNSIRNGKQKPNYQSKRDKQISSISDIEKQAERVLQGDSGEDT